MAIDFNPEDKITYEDLSKSLRSILDSMKKYLSEDQKKDITNIGTKIEELNERIKKIKKNGGIQESIWTGDMKESSSKGQVLKVKCPTHKIDKSDKNKKEINTPGAIYTHDEFMQKRVVTNDDELNTEFTNKPTLMIDIFNTWIRYAHFNAEMIRKYLDKSNWNDTAIKDGQNLSQYDQYDVYINKKKDGWTFNKQTNEIVASYDYMPAAGFISPENNKYYYYLLTRVDTGWDDDNLMVIVGYTRDSNGVEHTLSVVRGSGFSPTPKELNWGHRPSFDYNATDTFFTWGLIYDMCNSTQHIIYDLTKTVGYRHDYNADHGWSVTSGPNKDSVTNVSYIKVTREANYLKMDTTQFTIKGDDTYFNPDYTIEFSCPDTKPADWPQEMYDNIKEMMTKPNHVGFGCRSGQPRFAIIEQSGIFDDTDIYALHQNKQYYFNYFTNKWEVKQKITDNKDISPKTFLYNENLNNLIFLNRETDTHPFTWSKLELNKMPAYKKIKF